MASKRSISTKHVDVDGGEHQQPPNKAEGEEELSHETDGGGDSDSATLEEDVEASTPTVTPKKPKLTLTRHELGSELGGDGSECSSPSVSAFMIMPSSKPGSKKKSAVANKFTEEEEIALLKGLAAFWANGRNNKWAEFHLFIKDDLPRELTKIQVSEKIRGLKRKYDTHLEKARANGGRLDISHHHEAVLFELSKKLWGDEKAVENGQVEVKKAPARKDRKNIVLKIRQDVENDGYDEKRILKKHDQQQAVEISKEEFELEFPLLCLSFDALDYPKFVKDSCHLIGWESAQELEEKWRELNAEELRLEDIRIELTKRELRNHHMNL